MIQDHAYSFQAGSGLQSLDGAARSVSCREEFGREVFSRTNCGDLPVLSAKPMLMGRVNSTWEIDTPVGSFVMRVARSGHSKFEKERRCIEAAHEVSAALPEVYDVCRVNFGGEPLSVYVAGKVPGPTAREFLSSLPPDMIDGAKQQLWRDLGRLSSEFHKVPVTGFGEVLSRTGLPLQFSHASRCSYLNSIVRDLLSPHSNQIYSIHLPAEAVQRAGDALRRFSCRPVPPSLSHGDLSFDNVTVSGGRVAGVFDFGNAGSVSPLRDLSEIITWRSREEVRAFRSGFEMRLAESDFDEVRGLVYMRSLGALLWAARKDLVEVVDTVNRATYNLTELDLDNMLAD